MAEPTTNEGRIKALVFHTLASINDRPAYGNVKAALKALGFLVSKELPENGVVYGLVNAVEHPEGEPLDLSRVWVTLPRAWRLENTPLKLSCYNTQGNERIVSERGFAATIALENVSDKIEYAGCPDRNSILTIPKLIIQDDLEEMLRLIRDDSWVVTHTAAHHAEVLDYVVNSELTNVSLRCLETFASATW